MSMAAKMLVRGRRRFFMAMAKDQSFHTYFSGNASAILGRVSHRAPTSAGSWLEQSLSRSGVSLRELQRSFSVLPAAGESNDRQQKDISEKKPSAIAEKPSGSTSEYWGINANKVVKEDGSPWPWNCFQPADSYQPDITIDLKKHHRMDSFLDSVAFWIVKFLRVPTDIVPQKLYVYRVMMLETVAAVPGMVGGMLLHLRSLRKFEHSGGWIKALLEEAENERMHLMTWMEVKRPNWLARALVFIVQGGFFNTYFVAYIFSPRLAHRIVGYLEEEAVYSYTKMLAAIDNGIIPNSRAPSIAIDYWRLPKDATIRDVVVVIRADEAHHRDVNHFAADVHKKGKSLREAPAPVGFR